MVMVVILVIFVCGQVLAQTQVQAPRARDQTDIRISDVFIRPSVRRHRLFADVTVSNTSPDAAQVKLSAVVTDPNGDGGRLPLNSRTFLLGPGDSQMVMLHRRWHDLRLWSPDDPHLYELRVTLSRTASGQLLDERTIRFGFREIWTEDGDIRLNDVHFNSRGVRLEKFAPLSASKQDQVRRFLEALKVANVTTIQVPSDSCPDWLLEMADQMGILVVEDFTSRPRQSRQVGELLRKRIVRDRNHPSVMAWNLRAVPSATEAPDLSEQIKKIDPTRPVMCDNAGPWARSADIVVVHPPAELPHGDGAFPQALYWLAGRNKDIMGDKAVAVSVARRNKPWQPDNRLARMWIEAYRYCGAAYIATFGPPALMTGMAGNEELQKAYAPVAAFIKELHRNYESGKGLMPTVTVFNDTLRRAQLELSCRLIVGGQARPAKRRTVNLQPGEHVSVKVPLPLPEVSRRTPAVLQIAVRRNGRLKFQDEKPIAIFPPPAKARIGPRRLILYDPIGTTRAALLREEVAFLSVKDLSAATLERFPPDGHVLVIGDSALTGVDSLAAVNQWVDEGGVMLCLTQRSFPTDAPGGPVVDPVAATEAFVQVSGHPALAGIASEDLQYWRDDCVVVPTALRKPTATDSRIVVGQGEGLQRVGMMDLRYGDGLVVYSQLDISDKSATEPAARRILVNLVGYVTSWTGR